MAVTPSALPPGAHPEKPPCRARDTRRDGGIASSRDADRAARPEDIDPGSERVLRCRVCGAPVTSPDQRLEVAGSHVHRRVNPAEVEFEFGCFGEARVAILGPPSAEFSWFEGYLWSYASCQRCGSHLGWLFEGREPRFHGLILDRLVEDGNTTGRP